MTVTVKYTYKADEGTEVVNFDDWVKTLSADEQAEFSSGHRGHSWAVAAKIAEGSLTVEYTPEMTYVWTTVEAADAGLGSNPVWEKYHNRYLAENNIKLEITKQ